MSVRYDRLILAMDDGELEKFCREWVEKKAGYFEVRRYGASGDKGRDVVGFLTDQKHEGEWDNYQCKQYRTKLDKPRGLLAIGTVLYWAWKKEFTAPRFFFFVAPRGLNRPLESLVDKPSELRTELDSWDTVCAKKIVDKQTIALDASLRAFISAYPFHQVKSVTIDEIMADPAVTPILHNLYGADPGDYPPASVPATVQIEELPYIRALVDAYSERENVTFADHDAVFLHASHGPDLRMHRDRFYQADGFQKFYRDNTSPQVIEKFRKDIRFGVHDKWKAPSVDILARVDAVMEQASTVAPAGPLQKYGYVPVKQGICHHFVNEGELDWKKAP